MVIYKVSGNTLQIVACPPEDLRKGDYLLVRDSVLNRSLIVQVINTEYANVPGLLEDILRESSTEQIVGTELDILEMKTYMDMIKDAQLFTCKIRKSIINGIVSNDISWTPNRTTSRLVQVRDEDLLKLAGIGLGPSITVGKTRSGAEVSTMLKDYDGCLNIVAGKKGSGKSHLAKLLLLGLISNGGICVVFDINGEYVNLGRDTSGGTGEFNNKIIAYTPGSNFKVTLQYIGLGVVLSLLSSVVDLPPSSASELRRIWKQLESSNQLTLHKLREAIASIKNDFIREALIRRYDTLLGTNFFTDERTEAITLENVFSQLSKGGALVINLSKTSPMFRKIIVEFVLRKLSYLLERWMLRAVFLFAEEAHLYLRETYWEDVVTRMRHLGLFATFVTNQPDSVDYRIYRQADNIFLFNFTNENDLSTVSKATMVDVDTINIIAKELSPRHCLILGKVVKGFPLIVKVNPLNVRTMGETRLFFVNLIK